jgi:hypothetical protein
MEIVSFPYEKRIRFHFEMNVKVTRRSPVHSCISPASDSQADTRINTRRNPDVNITSDPFTPFPLALRAGRLYHTPRSAAASAGNNRDKLAKGSPGSRFQLPTPSAIAAFFGVGPGLGASPPTMLATFAPGNANALFDPKGCFTERDIQRALEIVSLAWGICSRPGIPSHEIVEKVAENIPKRVLP